MLKDTMEPPHVDAANSEIISTTLFNSDEISGQGRGADSKSDPCKQVCQRKPASKIELAGPDATGCASFLTIRTGAIS